MRSSSLENRIFGPFAGLLLESFKIVWASHLHKFEAEQIYSAPNPELGSPEDEQVVLDESGATLREGVSQENVN